MPYLISDISDDTELLPVNASISNPTYPLFYDLASETVKVLAGANTTEWQVARGVGNTQAVRHSRGTPLVLNASPYGGGGSVDNPSLVAFAVTPTEDPTPSGSLAITEVEDQSSSALEIRNFADGIVMTVGSPAFQWADPTSGTLLRIFQDGTFSVRAADGSTFIDTAPNATYPQLQIGARGSTVVRADDGTDQDYLLISAASAPPDALLFNGSCAFWYDPSNGAPKLMIKAKTNDGTVVTGSLSLAP